MYWIYLLLFVAMIFTPELVGREVFFLSEENAESVVIFCFGILGLLLYLAKESTLIRTVKEKIFLQRETNQIRKDLSQSYSYIGQMNRRFDIVTQSLLALPTSALRVFAREKQELYRPVFDAVRLLTHSRKLLLLFVSTPDGRVLARQNTGGDFPKEVLEGKHLLATKKFFWEEHGVYIVRSPEDAFETATFLIFEKVANRSDDIEAFQILAAEALFLYCIETKKMYAALGEKGGDQNAYRN